MAHRITKRKKAVLAGNLHPHYRETVETVSGMSDHEISRAAAIAARARPISSRPIDNETSCVVVQTPDYLRACARPAADCRKGACGGRAVDRGCSPRSCRLAWSFRRARWARISSSARDSRSAMRLNFGGPYVGLFATPPEVRAADAGPARRRNGRCRGQARLRADTLDARAAYPPREGDLEHLHEFRPLHARLQHPPHACSAKRACDGWRGQSRQCR